MVFGERVIFLVCIICSMLTDCLSMHKPVSGFLQCDSSVLSYEVMLAENSAKKIKIHWCMKDEESKDASSGDYFVDRYSWLRNETCRDIFLNKISKKISELGGLLPSIADVKKIAYEVGNMSDIRVTSLEQFLAISDERNQTIVNLRFNDLELGESFLDHFLKITEGKKFDTVEFENCRLVEDVNFSEILDSCMVENLSIINCSISESDLAETLLRVNSYYLSSLDLSHNRFTNSAIEMLKERIDGKLSLVKINLEGSGLDSKGVDSVKVLCHERCM